MNGLPDKVYPDWLRKYYDRGFRLIFYQTKQKGPSGQEAVGWTERSDSIDQYIEGQNIGVFTGHEISPGKFLCDVDFDWVDGFPLAKHILPETGFGFGRPSRATSHAFYTSPEAIVSRSFDDIDGRPFVELRGTKQDGTAGLQTMIPPSIHPNGEQLKLLIDNEFGHVDNLEHLVTLYAVACILYANFSDRNFVHEARLATAGFLLTEGLSFDDTIKIGEAICNASGNNNIDYKLVTKTTHAKIKQGDRVTGKGSLIKLLGEHGKEIVARIKEWLGSSDFFEDAKGKPIANNQDNIKRAIDKIDVQLSYDIFAQKPLITYQFDGNGNGYKGVLVDAIVTETWLEIDERYQFRPAKDLYYDIMQNIANKNKFHPVLDYFKSLTWDGVPRVDEWLIKAGGAADTDYVRAISSIMMIAAVRRTTQPGCKYDEMVVLESATQGLLKSTALRTLCPNEEWFSDDLPLNVDSKQIVERTLGKLIIEASDLSGMSPNKIEHLKGMLSRQVDGPVRLAYGRLPVEVKRGFIVVGTTNSYSYLSDSTGNRRFWPIRVKQFDIQWIKDNRDQLWAEAVTREGNKESIRLDPKLYAHAALQQERRRAEDPWETKLDEVFALNKIHRLTPDEVWAVLNIPIERRDPTATTRVLNAMHKLGFKRMSVRNDENKVVKGFGRDIVEGQLELDEEK